MGGIVIMRVGGRGFNVGLMLCLCAMIYVYEGFAMCL